MSSPTDQTDGIPGMPAAITASVASNGEQKRACTNDAHEEPEGKKRRVVEAEEDSKPPAEEDAEPCCWICLSGGSDDSGQPLRRDCSCRGAAGFAHLSCLVMYAKHETDDWDGDMDYDSWGDFRYPWRYCPNCWQVYRNELALDVATALASFVEARYPNEQQKLLEALRLTLNVYCQREDQMGDEAKTVCHKILSIVEQIRPLSQSDDAAHALDVEIYAYNILGQIYLNESSAKRRGSVSAKRAVESFEKMRDLCIKKGADYSIAVAEDSVAGAKAMLGLQSEGSHDILERDQHLYKLVVAERGEESPDAIEVGDALARSLKDAKRVIEAERLAAKLFATCVRLHGPGHALTNKTEQRLQKCKERWVSVRNESIHKWCLALRYKEGEKMCLVQGPIEEPRNTQEEETFTVASEDVVVGHGTPVICHCLGYLTRSNREIDGKVGVAWSWDDKRNCYEIRFEDGDLQSRWVKKENVRILFDLPTSRLTLSG